MRTGIALGSNLGDRAAQMAAARDFVFALHEDGSTPLCSGLYETDPVDCAPGTAPFLNAVVEIESSLAPDALLKQLRGFEEASGRGQTRVKNCPRTIDLDLLYAGDTRIDTPELTLPHPRMTTRRFVLQAMAELRADLVLPGEASNIAFLLAHLPATPAVRLVARTW